MHDTPTTPLPGSWLTSRLGVNPREIEELRENGELFAVRGQEEWLYPAWQFGPGGSIPAGVRNAVKAARKPGARERSGGRVVHVGVSSLVSGSGRRAHARHPQHEAESGEREQGGDQAGEEETATHQIDAAIAAAAGSAGT